MPEEEMWREFFHPEAILRPARRRISGAGVPAEVANE
jgi:hypothetical protein